MSYYRTDEWKKLTSYGYADVNVVDFGDKIEIDLRSMVLQKPWASAQIIWMISLLFCLLFSVSGGLLFLATALSGDREFIAISLTAIAIGVVFWYVGFRMTALDRKGKIIVSHNELRFRLLDHKTEEWRTIPRNYFEGTEIIQSVEHHFYANKDQKPDKVFYLHIRFSGVKSAVAGFDSPVVAQNAALLINEALRQDFTGKGKRDSSTITEITTVRVVKNDDL